VRAPKTRRIVVKLGTGVLTSGGKKLDEDRLAALCAQMAALRIEGMELYVVSSGAVGLGMGTLGLDKRPRDLGLTQACAAIGQGKLMQIWQDAFEPHGITVAQVLLTHDDLRVRTRYLGVRETLRQLIACGAVPVINENDAVSAAELEYGAGLTFGDNDTLSAMVASAVEADTLVILSTTDGLIDFRGTGKVVPVIEKITPEIEAMAGGTMSETAVGGMASKISAAKLATRAGCAVFIASGAEPDVLPRLLSGRGPGSFFVPSGLPLDARKRWLAYFQRPTGTLHLSATAVPPLRDEGRSLLAVGVTGSSGVFAAGDVVNIAGPDGTVFARGETAFSSDEVAAIAGLKGDAVRARYPKRKRLEVVHRNNLVLL
jgi:glutamate 5-kinase